MFKRTLKRIRKKSFYKNKKSKQRKSRKSRKILRKNKYVKKQKAGGEWLTYGNVDRNDICQICNQKFYDTPDKAIYKTNCNHLFHNSCLNNLCEENNGDLTCPTCHQDNIDCMSIWAFEKQALGNPNANRPAGVEDDEVFEVYNKETGVPQTKKRS